MILRCDHGPQAVGTERTRNRRSPNTRLPARAGRPVPAARSSGFARFSRSRIDGMLAVPGTVGYETFLLHPLTPPTPWESGCEARDRSSALRKWRATLSSCNVSSLRSGPVRVGGREASRFSSMARRRRATCTLSAPYWRISVTASSTKSSQSGVRYTKARPPRAVSHHTGVELAKPDLAQEVVNLVDGEHGGRRVVDRRR